jgi:uncharacterized RDD family membrane protein YckC
VSAGLEHAGLLRRLAAMIYDALLVLAILMATITVLVALTNHAVAGPYVLVIGVLEAFAFFAYFWMFRGQTLGMLAWRLAVRSETGGSLTLEQCVMRFAGAALSLACAGLGYLWILVDRDGRSWSDILSDSVIVRLPR